MHPTKIPFHKTVLLRAMSYGACEPQSNDTGTINPLPANVENMVSSK